MIEIMALAATVTQIGSSLSTAIGAGKDIASLLPHFGKLAKLETEINLAERGKHKGPLGRLTSSEEEGFAIAQAKLAHQETMNQLREICSIYGIWNVVQHEMAEARKRHKEALEEQARRRDQMFWGLSLTAGVLIFIAGISFMIWGADALYNG